MALGGALPWALVLVQPRAMTLPWALVLVQPRAMTLPWALVLSRPMTLAVVHCRPRTLTVLTVPVHLDETVIEDRLRAGYGPPSFLIGGELDQRCLRVVLIGHLERSRRGAVRGLDEVRH